MLKQVLSERGLWLAFGLIAWLVFYSRFYVQWVASEYKGRSVIPTVFWYQSALGSLMLLAWAWHTASPIGALSQSFNLIPYSRNLVHIWREKGAITRWRSAALHTLVALVVLTALGVLVYTTKTELEVNEGRTAEEAQQAWFWIGVGLAGQLLFAGRVLVQWAATEIRRKSVVPAVFWYLSVVAASLQFLTFAVRGGGEWLFALGMLATLFVYIRNIWFIHRGRSNEVLQTGAKHVAPAKPT